MTVEEFLAGVESRLTAATPGPWEQVRHGVYGPVWARIADTENLNGGPDLAKVNAVLIASAPTDLAKLTTALRGVLALHQSDSLFYGDLSCDRCDEPYPCPTVTSITDALGDES